MIYYKSIYTVLQTTEGQKPFSVGTWTTWEEAVAGRLNKIEKLKSRFVQARMWDKNTVIVPVLGSSEKVRFDIVEIPLPGQFEDNMD